MKDKKRNSVNLHSFYFFQRFGDSKKDSPAPGTYNDPRNSLEILKRYKLVVSNLRNSKCEKAISILIN